MNPTQKGLVLKRKMVFLSAGVVLLAALYWVYDFSKVRQPPIKVGVLFSLTGTMAISETAVVDATLLAIKQINQSGGLLGRQIQPIIVDGKSDWSTFAAEAERLIIDEKVSVLFACWTSACRKTIKPVVEQYHHLLFYPVQYEGLESSAHIVYTGATPNQQITPAVSWAIQNGAKKIFLLGSDYIFPRAANEIIKDFAYAHGVDIVAEIYLPLGSQNVAGTIEQIKTSNPDVILNTINGDSNIAFFSALKKADITASEIPVISFSIGEHELLSLGIENMIGHYASWNYFQTIENKQNRQFIEDFQQQYGENRRLNDPMESAFIAVQLWAKSVNEAGTDAVNQVILNLANQSYKAPGGLVNIESGSMHLWKTPRIGKINRHALFDIVWQADKPYQPFPFPITRTRTQWLDFLDALYQGYGQQWAKSEP